MSRYSFLGIEPFYILKTRSENSLEKLRGCFSRYKFSLPGNSIPFLGGAVGYFSYDFGLSLQDKVKIKKDDDVGLPDCFFAFYNTLVIIDHFKRLLQILCLGFPERRYSLAKSLCEANFRKIHRIISKADSKVASHLLMPRVPGGMPEIKSNFTKEEYICAIKKAKEYIRNGDIYQVNLSQRFQATTGFSAYEIYQRLRSLSPSYFSAYLDAGDFQVLSSSPERFLKLEGNTVITRPMKGTRPRSADKSRDLKLKNELLNSRKDKAELVMIVDLERNDLGRVCSYGSIKVSSLRNLEKYNTVFQTTATIEGHLHKDKDRFDLLVASLPGGSITGCPKIRAMEIIEELEPQRRSIYTGAMGYLSFSGDMDFNILIRTILKKKDTVYFGVGGGIVADSEPEKEYAETLVKAKAMMKAINEAY